jgi:predicted alpha/beta-fold hydrolase
MIYCVRTLIIQSIFHAFVSPLCSDFYPFEKSVDGGNDAPIKMVRTKHGGHLGFMFHQLSENEKMVKRPASWMPMELARFFHHVHDKIQ